jgi:homospermidine synthase
MIKIEYIKMKVLMIGCGGLGKALLELMVLKKINHEFEYIDLIDPKEIKYPIFKYFRVRHHRRRITKDNVDDVFTPLLADKDIVVDVSVNVDCMTLMKRCRQQNILYINTSLENWDDEDDMYKRTLHYRYMEAMSLFPDKNGTTFICDHGFNPGMISHLARKALADYCEYKNQKKPRNKREFALAAKRNKLRTIHISEIDTQRTNITMDDDTFYNTWSAIGFIEEGVDPIQFGYGTHEEEFIEDLNLIDNIAYGGSRGVDIVFKSVAVLPDETESYYSGWAIPHGEANTLSKYFSTKDYRPSVYYVYHPSEPAIKSIHKLGRTIFVDDPNIKEHVLSLPEIENGFDSIGAHLFFENGDRWWTGSILTVEDVKKMGVEHSGPTEVQVAISLLSAILWMKHNKNKGILFPEDLPYQEMIEQSYPYLGLIYSNKIKSIPHDTLINLVDT